MYGGWGKMANQKNSIPRQISQVLDDEESVLYAVRQSRIFSKDVVTPAMLFVTNKRVIQRDPKLLGLKSEIIDYLYRDMANIELKHGIFFSDLKINVRFNSKPVKIKALSKSDAVQIHKLVNKGIQGTL